MIVKLISHIIVSMSGVTAAASNHVKLVNPFFLIIRVLIFTSERYCEIR